MLHIAGRVARDPDKDGWPGLEEPPHWPAAEHTQVTGSFNTDPPGPEDPDAFERVGRTLASDAWIPPPHDA